ncbi:metallophosphoesterase family protein [Acuticoccus sp. MNP-M23]|uniref:metallophosphoesterase family protein n=1 Tax=Acuticoccus sp. MNP-M23 TaxID=3072793 RepID=UPI0028154001|nr:metallophosphoesterase family protein [Acuticoccus sp. MNP-M23]WMS42116.1 metallophosphoesterase family protein [Acuticoccus sp. MNP-M23]
MRPNLPPGQRVYAIGDIHGMKSMLDSMLDMIDAHLAENPCPGPVTEIFLGDYIDRGPDSYGVIERLMEPACDGRTRHCLLGNHEDAMLSALSDGSMLPRWLSFGGEATCRSYGVDPAEHPQNPHAVQTLLQAALPPTHRAFLSNLSRSETIGDTLFVHAGIRPDVPLDRQDIQDLIWIRDDFLEYTGPLPAHVVHGHTPVREADLREYRTNVDTAAVYGGALSAAVIEGNSVSVLRLPTPK